MAQTIVITGASSGIGKATAHLFHARGWNVAATMRRPDLVDWAPVASSFGLFALDVTDPVSIERALGDIDARFGRIDVLVNNAGYALVGPFEASNPVQIERQFATNVSGLFNVTRAVLRRLRMQGGGILINVASVGGRTTAPLLSVYHATKWAIEGFSESLQFEVEPFNIRIKVIEPGAIKTAFYGRSMEIAHEPGLTAYDGYTERVLSRMQRFVAHAPGPERVARAIYCAATDGSRRLRYSPRAGVILALRWWLPHALFTRAVKAALGR